ncbi:MAG TPA: iron-sulfur cluster assembly protein [Fimbriimonadaceae bacterium]|nr:iron-sulfur cluster assembly protein [Fimbriimonadaceae bacterium]
MPEPIRKQETDVEPVRRSGLNSIERTVLEGEVVDVLRCIYDPEIPVNIYDLGLIYEVAVDESADARIVMTLTSPMCPVAEELPLEVEEKVRLVPSLKNVTVELTWDPPFSVDRMSDEVKLLLGLL